MTMTPYQQRILKHITDGDGTICEFNFGRSRYAWTIQMRALERKGFVTRKAERRGHRLVAIYALTDAARQALVEEARVST